MIRTLSVVARSSLVLLLALSACKPKSAQDASAAPPVNRAELTQRQRDSISATLPIPGASGIGRALDASDAQRARAAQHDSLLANP
jgi:hypothetical protein